MHDICCVDGEGVYFRNRIYIELDRRTIVAVEEVTENKDVCIFWGQAFDQDDCGAGAAIGT